jgi:DNA-binding NtrC family response regulator
MVRILLLIIDKKKRENSMMFNYECDGRSVKTILLAFQNGNRREYLTGVLSREGYRILCADSPLSLIESLNDYCIDLLISQVKLPGISMEDFLPFLRQRHLDIKVIIAVEDYSPKLELSLRPYKILYMMQLPVSENLLRSVVARGLEIGKESYAYVNQ